MLWRRGFECGHDKNQNLELLLSAADFHFCLGTEGVPLCTCVHQQVLQKSIDI